MESISDLRDAFLNWMCGTNFTQPVRANLRAKSFGLFVADQTLLQNTCLVDTVTSIPHVLAILMFPLILISIRCCNANLKGLFSSKYLIKYPGHGRRWVCILLLIVALIGSGVEGALTDARYRHCSHPTQPHLYLPDACAVLATILAILFNHQMEVWRRPKMAWLLLIYWSAAIAGNSIYLIHLDYRQLAEPNIATFDFAVITLALHGILLLNELNVIRLKASICLVN